MSVDREGDFSYSLRPRREQVAHRLVCDVKVKDNVKIVTLRSSMKIENKTHLPMELVLIDASGKSSSHVYKIREWTTSQW
jgi:vacuolar protein sorting-associated protein 13A/C